MFLVLVGLIGGSESRWAYHAAFWGFAIVLLNVIVMTIYTGISNRAYLLDNEWIEPVKKKTRLEKLADKTVQSMIDGFNSPKAKSS